MTSDDPTVWDDPVCVQRPAEPWDLVQLGNCGSPIESPAGWIMGSLFSVERLWTGNVFASVVTHCTWTTLMVLAFPR